MSEGHPLNKNIRQKAKNKQTTRLSERRERKCTRNNNNNNNKETKTQKKKEEKKKEEEAKQTQIKSFTKEIIKKTKSKHNKESTRLSLYQTEGGKCTRNNNNNKENKS